MMNKFLLMKWLWKLDNSDGLWQTLLAKRLTDGASGSHFWQGLMKFRDSYLSASSRVVGDGAKTLIWEDVWLGNKILSNYSLDYITTLLRRW